jgi:Raf kinase inhibitor-like YbhB/YbcL family protein
MRLKDIKQSASAWMLSLLSSVALILSVSATAGEFTLKSDDFAKSPISPAFEYTGFGCNGENQSPSLTWQGAPEGTKSFAVTAYDPDAPTGSGWWHWQAINIPVAINYLPKNAGAEHGKNLPLGTIQFKNDYGVNGWGGFCPPKGDKPHRYIFTIYAMGVEKITPPEITTAAMVGFIVKSNSLGQTSFTVEYGR